MIPIKIKMLHPFAVIPEYKTSGAACFDLVATDIERVSAGKVKIKFGIAVEIPEGYKMCIVPRSGRCLKGWVQINTPGQVDSDYRGELMWFLDGIPIGKNADSLYYEPLEIGVGQRCAQAWIEKVIKAEFEVVEELSETERGEGGFGSTGNHQTLVNVK